MKRALLLLLLGAALATPAAAETPGAAPFASAPVSDQDLSTMRGGIMLPNGLVISLGVDIQTWVDGMLVLHTIYASDGPNAGVRVYTGGTNASPPPSGTTQVSFPGADTPGNVVVSRSPTGTTIIPAASSSPVTLNIVSGAPTTWPAAQGETPVPVMVNGPVVMQGPGTFRLSSDGGNLVSSLATSNLQIEHLVGQASGFVVANTANDRAIETVASVNVDLQGFSPALMTALFSANRVALDAVRR